MALYCHIQCVDDALDHENKHKLCHNEHTYDSLFWENYLKKIKLLSNNLLVYNIHEPKYSSKDIFQQKKQIIIIIKLITI